MAAEVEAGNVLLLRHELPAGIFLQSGNDDPGRGGGSRKLIPQEREEIHLSFKIVPFGAGNALERGADRLHQGMAGMAHAVKAAGKDHILHSAAVELAPGHAAEEIFKITIGTELFAFGNQLGYRAAPHAFDGGEAEADVAAGNGEVRFRFIDVRRKESDAHIAAFGNIDGDFGAAVEHGSEQGCHVLLGVVPLHVGGAVADNGVAHGVGFVEGIAGKV